MKPITRILLMALALMPCVGHAAAPLSGTAGSNLTSYNPNGGASNNNQWNGLMNNRGNSAGATATADFGNCNSVILRCASPKCSGGGCTDMGVAATIVSGCVNSNDSCKQYGNDLIQYIAAQLVASSNAKASAQAAAAAEAQAAASAQADAAAQQMQMMQSQMQQMQDAMAAQTASMQAALEESQRQTAEALAAAQAASSAPAPSAPAASSSSNTEPAPTSTTTSASTSSSGGGGTVMDGLTEAQRIAAANGVSADVLVREQVSGQIMQYLTDAQNALDTAKAAMVSAINYAGCETNGDNCSGPKRVSVFRQKALGFFDAYDAVLDSLYDAMIMAQTVGVDIGDIYMMLNDSCTVWAEYVCYGGMETYLDVGATGFYTRDSKGQKTWHEIDPEKLYASGTKVTKWAVYDTENCVNRTSKPSALTRGNNECEVGAVIPPEDSPGCTMNRMLHDMETVQRNFLFADAGDMDEHIRVGCADKSLKNSRFFKGRKQQAKIDIETLKSIISQDSSQSGGGFASFRGRASVSDDERNANNMKYCMITDKGYQELRNAATKRSLPARVCVTEAALTNTYKSEGVVTAAMTDEYSRVWRENQGKYDVNPFVDPEYTNCSACTSGNGTPVNRAGQKLDSCDPAAAKKASEKDIANMDIALMTAFLSNDTDKVNVLNTLIETRKKESDKTSTSVLTSTSDAYTFAKCECRDGRWYRGKCKSFEAINKELSSQEISVGTGDGAKTFKISDLAFDKYM